MGKAPWHPGLHGDSGFAPEAALTAVGHPCLAWRRLQRQPREDHVKGQLP